MTAKVIQLQSVRCCFSKWKKKPSNFTDRLPDAPNSSLWYLETCLMLWSDKVEHLAFSQLHNLCINNCDSQKQRTCFSSWSNNFHMFTSDKNIPRLIQRSLFIISDTNRWSICPSVSPFLFKVQSTLCLLLVNIMNDEMMERKPRSFLIHNNKSTHWFLKWHKQSWTFYNVCLSKCSMECRRCPNLVKPPKSFLFIRKIFATWIANDWKQGK